MALKIGKNKFWSKIPAWKDVTEEEFSNDRWQLKNSVTKLEQLSNLFEGKLCQKLIEDLKLAQLRAPMNIRVTPYIISLIDWENLEEDPIRKQFIPLAREYLPDHPFTSDDPLAESEDSPTKFLIHRYPDKVLFLPITTCPVYCAYCTRSRLVGGSTTTKTKDLYGASSNKWTEVFNYLEKNTAIEDVVISGGDSFQIPPRHLYSIGESLLKLPNIKRIRYATKGLAIMPMKILSDNEWVHAINLVKKYGDRLGKEVAIHTHFNHSSEITEWTKAAMQQLTDLNIRVRNQSVLLSGINDQFEVMKDLIKNLVAINIDPYYIYLHDMVSSCEHFRTNLSTAINLSKKLEGATAGFHIPKIVCDLPGGGGKHSIHSYEAYDSKIGISVWTSPSVKPGKVFYYYDPLHFLSKEVQGVWKDKALREKMLNDFKNSYRR